MFLTVHATAGAFVGAAAGGPLSAFLLGLASHAVLDIIPHGDEEIGAGLLGRAKTRLMLKFGIVDSAIMIAVLAYLLQPWQAVPSWMVLAGIAGGVLPDGLQLLARFLSKSRTLARYVAFHDFLHLRVVSYELPIALGMSVQTLSLIALIRVFPLVA